ncbi:MAG: cytochrome c maturation protein CcmE [Acidimicrobiia bacterium]
MTDVQSPPAAADEPRPARPPRPKRKGRYIVAVGGCVVAVVAIIVLAVALSENVVYFRTVSEAVADRKSQGTDRFRLAGGVVDDSIEENQQKGTVTFEVTDGTKTVTVRHEGDTPALFKNGAPVVCEGHWASTSGAPVFVSDRILIKHGASYTPPKVDTKKASTS